MSKRVKIGDVVEIQTCKGLAYCQVTHTRKSWGSLLRVLPGFLERRPKGFHEILQQEEKFATFFPLQFAVSHGIFKIVANEAVPERALKFPLFRAAGFIDRKGRVHDWWLWDGEQEWQIGKLKKKQLKLPILEVINDTLLVERIEGGWIPREQSTEQG